MKRHEDLVAADERRHDELRQRAADLVATLPGSDQNGEHEVTETAGVIEHEGGAFVQAWVWIPPR